MEKYGSRIKLVSFCALTIILLGTAYCLSIGKYDYLISLYAITAMLLLGLVVFLRAPADSINWSFFGLTVAIVIWSFSIMRYWGSSQDQVAMFWAIYANIGGAFIPAFFVQFTECFPEQDKRTITPLKLFYWFAPAGLLTFAVSQRLVIADVVSLTVVPGAVYLPYMIYILSYFAIAYVNLIRKHNQFSGMVRMQIRYIFLGSVLCSIFPLLFNQILPLLGNSSLTRFGPYFTIIFVAFAAYAITKHRLLDISVIISRTLAELLVILLHGAAYLGLVLFYRAKISTQIDPLFLVGSVLYGVFVGQTHNSLRMFLQTTSEKIFLRGKYDYYKELSAASSRVVEKLSLPEILKVLYQTFSDVMEISNPRIMLPENFADPVKDSNQYVVFDRVTAQPAWPEEAVIFADPLVKKLVGLRGPLLDPSDPIRELIVPCVLEERLIAMFVFGRKLSEDPFTEEDLRLLQALSSQAAVAFDHTLSYDKIKSDLAAAEHQLERSQRLAALGTLTAGVTHEIRNPLTVIRGETERLTNQSRDLDYLKTYRELMLKHIDRIAGIVERMLGLAKEKQHREVEVMLNELAETTLQFFALNGIKVVKALQPVPAIKADPEELQEVFVNLIQNAIEAMPNGGTLTIKTYQQDGHVVVEAADTGKGIPAEIREKIFDPFFSTRHEGAGLGLSIVYRIVRECGGDIKVESEVGQGTTFKLLFTAAN